MSEQNKDGQGGTQQQPDPLTNLKAEMSRKLENSNAELAALKAQMAKLTQVAQPPKVEEEDDFDPYDPQSVRKHVGKQVQAGISAFQQEQQKIGQAEGRKQQVILSLLPEYPELQNPSSELVQAAKEALSELPPEEQNTAAGYKAAILEAASKKGIVPKSKRQGGGDETFQMGGSRTRSESKPPQEFREDVSFWMSALQEHTNVDFSKKEVRERVKQRQDRRFGGRK